MAIKCKLKIPFFVFFGTLSYLNRNRKAGWFEHLHLPALITTDKP